MYQSRWAPQSPPQTEKAKSQDGPTNVPVVDQPTVPPTVDPPTTAFAQPSLDYETNLSTEPVPSYDYSQPPPDVSSDEAFAQTGAQQDDLFDDVNPMEEESMRLRSDDDLFNDDFTPAPEPETEPVPIIASEQPEQPPAQSVRGRGDGIRGRGRGRGRGGRGDGRGQMRNSQNPPQGDNKQPVNAVPENAPSGPRKETVAAVRGDRQATGGIRKPRLTEEQLAEKMAEIQIKNASLTAAHARAEADAASFAEREQVAQKVAEQRRKEERRDRQQMMGEREQNRQRKLKAMEGREWDAGKRDEDFGKGGKFDKRGGFAGDKEDYTDGREYLLRESKGGDRGRGSRRGGKEAQQQRQDAPKQEDFPALPSTSSKVPVTSKEAPAKITTDQIGQGKSWADQMESNTPS